MRERVIIGADWNQAKSQQLGVTGLGIGRASTMGLGAKRLSQSTNRTLASQKVFLRNAFQLSDFIL